MYGNPTPHSNELSARSLNRGALAALAMPCGLPCGLPCGHVSGSGDRAASHSAWQAHHSAWVRRVSAPRRAAEAVQQGGGIISSEWRPAPGQLRSDPWRVGQLHGPSKSPLVGHVPSGGDSGRLRHRAVGTLPSGAADREGRQRQQLATANAARFGGVLSGRGRRWSC